jgi:hypothetical protein
MLISEITLISSQSAVTKNVSEKSINNILEYVAGEGKVGCPVDSGQVKHGDANPDIVCQLFAENSMAKRLLRLVWRRWRRSTSLPWSP